MEKEKFLGSEGLSHLWQKIIAEDYANNESLMAVISAINDMLTEDIIPNLLPSITKEDDGKFLLASDGVWTAAAISSAEEAEL